MSVEQMNHDEAVARLRAELAAERDRATKLDICAESYNKSLHELRAELAALKARHSAPPYVFRRFRGGNEMAEGVIIESAETLEHAIAKAARFYPGTGTVFVIEDVAARKERDEARAELAKWEECAGVERAENIRLRAELAAARAVKEAIRNKLKKTIPLLDNYFRYDTQSDVDAVYKIIEEILASEGA